MRRIFIKLFEFFTEPLYRRLSREVTLELQRQEQASIESQEQFYRTILDELLSLSAQVESYRAKLESQELLEPDSTTVLTEASLSDVQIMQIVAESLSQERNFIEIAKSHRIAPGTIAILQAKYFGLDDLAIGRLRAIQKENAALKRENLILKKVTSQGFSQIAAVADLESSLNNSDDGL